MGGQILLAWAVPVKDETELCARLDAYVQTGDRITALIESLKHASSQNVREAPQEIIDIIAQSVAEKTYEEVFRKWHDMYRCNQKTCKTSDHCTRDQILGLLNSGTELGCFGRSPNVFQSDLRGQAYPKHDESMEKYLQAVRLIDGGKNPSVLIRAKEASLRNQASTTNEFLLTASLQRLMQEFGCQPYLTVLERHDPYPYGLCHWLASVSAYLVFPLEQVVPAWNPLRESASYAIQNTLNPANLSRGVASDVGPIFQKAIKALRLKSAHKTNVIKERVSTREVYRRWSERERDGFDWQDCVREIRESICLECDAPVCRGDKQQVWQPKLMILGHGTMQALPWRRR